MFTITWDPDQQLACLVDPETPRALGPVMAGPDAVTTLNAFVGALERDPLTLMPWELDAQFAEFVVAIQAMQAQAAEAASGDTPPPPEAVAAPAEPFTFEQAPSPIIPPAEPADTDQPEPAEAPEPVVTFDPFAGQPPRCSNCQATTFEQSTTGLVCAICGEPAPAGATA